MNLFVLDNDPETSAQSMCDKHIPKMVVETFQMMGSALRRHGATDSAMPLTSKGTPLIGGYKHHPVTIWIGDSITNFVWAALHGIALCEEYTMRYNKRHSCHNGILQMADMMDYINIGPQTPYAQAMPEEYRSENAVDSYRKYYKMDKAIFAKWEKGRAAPDWW